MKSFVQFLKEMLSTPEAVVVTFMRANPPTNGHEKLVNKMVDVAKDKGAKPIVYLSNSQDPKKNPLDFKDKVKLVKKAFPGVSVSSDSTLRTLFQIAGMLSDGGTKKFYLVVGSDRVEEFKKSLGKYVGATTGSLQLKFDEFEVISAGQRDENSDDVSGMSASKMRKFVIDDDSATFKTGLPKNIKSDYIKIFNLVKKGMKI